MLTKKQRIFVIIHLCLCLSLFLWNIGRPFLGEYLEIKKYLNLYSYLKGESPLLFQLDLSAMRRQNQRYNELPPEEKFLIESNHLWLLKHSSRAPSVKIFEGFSTFFKRAPLFEQGWLFFSILLMILILLLVPGAISAIWIIPILSIALICDQLQKEPRFSPDYSLFPDEKVLFSHFSNLNKNSSVQQEYLALQDGWDNYLLEKWVPKDSFSSLTDPHFLLEEGSFNFLRNRLKKWHDYGWNRWFYFWDPQPILFSYFFVGWSLVLAYVVFCKRNLS